MLPRALPRLLLAGLAGACGSAAAGFAAPDAGGPADARAQTASGSLYQNGSRLKAKVLVGSDGSQEWAGWHDTMLNFDCGFTQATDGSTRCMPAASGSTSYFLDAQCQRAILAVPKGACSPTGYTWVSHVHSGPCGTTTLSTEVRPIFGMMSGIGNVYSLQPNGICMLSGTASQGFPGYDFYETGAPLDPSTLVSAAVQLSP